MKYTKTNNIHIIEVPVNDFKVIMVDKAKRSAYSKNYVNAGFFGTFDEPDGRICTLPAGHVVCDYAATSSLTKQYCTERGTFNGSKFTFDSYTWSYKNQFYQKAVSTLIIDSSNRANIMDIRSIKTVPCKYALAGVPIIRHGADVKFATYVKSQGWDGSPLGATWHIFIGLKSTNASKVYIIGMRTYKVNMITAAEAYKKLKALGFYDVIKLDGGGSYLMNIDGNAQYTAENRRINTIITFSPSQTTIPSVNGTKYGTPTSRVTGKRNTYTAPVRTLRRGSSGIDVRWLQFQLNKFGYDCEIDGSFGQLTQFGVEEFQRYVGLDDDASVGPLTRTELKKI